MRDPDKVQEREFEQHQLVERIISSLHNLADDEESYQRMFFDIAECALWELRGKPTLGQASVNEFNKHVLEPITTFSKSPSEAKHLLFQVLEKVVHSIGTRIVGAYLGEELLAEVQGQI